MAMYRLDFKPRHRSDAQGGADLVRYFLRQGEFAPELLGHDADVDYMTRQSVDTREHDDLVGVPLIGNLPVWAEGSPGRYFAAAREYETRPGAQYAIALQIALPRELTHEQHMQLAQDFVTATLPRNPYLLVKHEPVRNGEPQPHLHILVGPRLEDGLARPPERHFRRYNPAHPEQGGAQKERFWNQAQAPWALRVAFADLTNAYLERAGVETRIDPRSLRGQGIDRDRITWTAQERARRENVPVVEQETRQREQAKARAAWEQRKRERGWETGHALLRAEMIEQVRTTTRQQPQGRALPPADREAVVAWEQRQERQRAADEQAAAQQVARYETYLQRVQHERTQEAHWEQRGEVRPVVGRQQAELVLAQEQRLEVTARGVTDVMRGHMRVKLWREETDESRGF